MSEKSETERPVTAISIWPEFGKRFGMTRAQAYNCCKNMPSNIKIRIGGRIWLNCDRLEEYLKAGGDQSNG